ncbi:MAG: PAS domain S-box protein [Candidatus Omnitrophica bacterium]|nr:PAS domain S-box protein [Candidatus Omnitrophota bacterium]
MRSIFGVQLKAAIIITLLVVVVSAALTLFFIENEKNIVYSNVKRQSKALADNFAYDCEYGLLSGNEQVLRDLIAGIMQQPDVIYCAVYDRDGKVAAQSDPDEGADLKTLLDEYGSEIRGLVTITTGYIGDELVFKVKRPVTSTQRVAPKGEAGILLVEEEWGWSDTGGVQHPTEENLEFYEETGTLKLQKIGSVLIIVSLENILGLVRDSQRTALNMAGLLLLAAVLAVILITRVAIIPIKMLVEATRKIAGGDLEVQVDIKTRDEIGELAEAFNKMAADLKKSTVSIEVLQAAQKRFEDVAENTGDWIWEMDPKGRYVYSSSGVEKILGYRLNEVVGKFFSDFIVPEEKEAAVEKICGIFDRKREFKDLDIQVLRKDGKIMTLEMTGIPVIDNDGKLVGYRGVSTDVTERKKVELSQRLAKLGSMVSDMAHEVNNPLQIVSGRAQLALMDNPEKEEVRNALKIIQDQCARAKDIIQRMLRFSKPGKGIFEPGDINDTIDFVVHLLEHQFSLVNITIEKQYGAALDKVNMDEKQMHEVFMNILKNAADAMPEGGRITIKSSQADRNVRIEISDTGEGISQENIKKVFDPFFTTKEQGTGLGLSVCYGIIKAHNGDLRYTSRKGEGTTATIVLPVAGTTREILKN